MPFTLAHAAAVLPLRAVLGRRAALMPALVVGSMTPDGTYLLRWTGLALEGHSLPGLVTFCLPAGVLGYFLFFKWIGPMLADLAPNRVQLRVPRTWTLGRMPSTPPALVALCILAGALTHLVWDSFTHASGPMVQALPGLAASMANFGGYEVSGYKILQHASTLLGLLVLVAWSHRHLPHNPSPSRRLVLSGIARCMALAALAVPGLAAGVASGLTRVETGDPGVLQLRDFVSGLVFTGGSWFLITVLIAAAAHGRLTRRLAGRPGPPADGEHSVATSASPLPPTERAK